MPSKKCKNPSCTETDPEFYAHRNLCKNVILNETEKGKKDIAKKQRLILI